MSQNARRTLIVTNPNGLHMRPLQGFVEQAIKIPGEVWMGRVEKGEKLNGKSMMHLLGLCAEQGSEVFIEVADPEGEAVMERLIGALQASYDE